MSTRLSTSSFLPAACSFAYRGCHAIELLCTIPPSRGERTHEAPDAFGHLAPLCLSHYRGSEKPERPSCAVLGTRRYDAHPPCIRRAPGSMPDDLSMSVRLASEKLGHEPCGESLYVRGVVVAHDGAAYRAKAPGRSLMRKIMISRGYFFVCGIQHSASARISSYWPSSDVSSGLKPHERSAGKPVCIDLWKPALGNPELKTGISEKCILLHRLAEECTFTLKKLPFTRT